MSILSEKLVLIVEKMGCHFTFKGQPIEHEAVFSEQGLLPGFAKRADQLASLCFGYALGANYKDLEEAPLGIEVEFNEQVSDIVRVFCILDILHDFVNMAASPSQIALDELMYE